MSITLRVLSWNCKRAKQDSAVWDYFSELDPDIALLQEVIGIPENIKSGFACEKIRSMGRGGLPQIFGTVILTKGQLGDKVHFTAQEEWISKPALRMPETCFLSTVGKPVPTIHIIRGE